MDKVKAKSTQEQKECKGCGKEYTSNILIIFKDPQDLSQGHCPDCREKKRKEWEAKQEANRQAIAAKQRLQWRRESGIPPKFMAQEFGTFERERQPKAYDHCLKYANEYPILYRDYTKEKGKAFRSLVLFSPGAWGLGKTHLASAIGHRILNRWNGEDIIRPVEFISEPDIYRRIQATYSYSSDEKRYMPSAEKILNRLIYQPLLIVDDIGKEKRIDSKFIQRTLFALIDARYRSMRPMVLTTNLSPDELKNYLGAGSDEASFDRLLEMCQGKFIKMTGESYRRK